MEEPLSAVAVIQFVAIIGLVLLNGFFVAAEFSIVKVRGTKIESLARKGSRRAKLTKHIIEHLDAYLSATQLGITIASILLGWIGESAMHHYVVGPILHSMHVTNETVVRVVSVIFGIGIITFLHVVLGELAPKSLAIQRSEATALWIAYPLKWFYIIMYPAIHGLNNTANFLLRMIGIQPVSESELAHSEEELRLLVLSSQQSGVLTHDKRLLLENVFELSRTIVRQIMVPRIEVAFFNLQKPLADNLKVAERTAHSRYPLVDGDLDHVVGLIHMKDLFWQLKEMESNPSMMLDATRMNPKISGGDISADPPSSGAEFLRKIGRDIPFVPETMRGDNLLREFQQKRVHLAMVVDEYGGTSGLVTFENVIEEIVGQVQDEFDEEAPQIRRVGENEYIVEGITALYDVNQALGTSFEAEDVDTVGGFILNELGRLPKPGDHVSIDGAHFTVREMRRQRIHRVHMKLEELLSEGDEESATAPVEQGQKTD